MTQFTKLNVLIAGILIFFTSIGVSFDSYIIDNKINEAYRISQLTEKPLLILFSIKGCQDCVLLKEQTLSDPLVSDFLNQRFIIVDINPIPFYFGLYPINDDEANSYSYDMLYKKFSVSRTPTLMFFNLEGNEINRLQGFYESSFLIETIRSFSPLYQEEKEPFIKPITDDETARLLLETLPNVKQYPYEEFKATYDVLNPLDYYIVQEATYEAVQSFLEGVPSPLKNVFVYEGELRQYQPLDTENDTQEDQTQAGYWTDIIKAQVIELLTEENPLTILDVRTPSEYEAGHIDGAINLNFLSDEFDELLSKMEKDAIYLVYCQSGGRSISAVQRMNELGFEYIYHYPGGYSDFSK